MFSISIIENKMVASLFSQLPNNLIMNIIKIAEDERKKEEKEIMEKNLKKHRYNFSIVISDLHEIEKKILLDYSQEERDNDAMMMDEQLYHSYHINKKHKRVKHKRAKHKRDKLYFDKLYFEPDWVC